MFQHQTMIRGDVGFTFASIDDQGINGLVSRREQLHMGREGGTSHSNYSGLLDPGEDIGVRQAQGIVAPVHLDPMILPIGFDDDCLPDP